MFFFTRAGDVDSFLQALEKLVGIKFAFKVETADYNIEREWYMYTIVKLTDYQHLYLSFLNTCYAMSSFL